MQYNFLDGKLHPNLHFDISSDFVYPRTGHYPGTKSCLCWALWFTHFADQTEGRYQKKTGKCGNFENKQGGSTRIPLPFFIVFNKGNPPTINVPKVLKCQINHNLFSHKHVIPDLPAVAARVLPNCHGSSDHWPCLYWDREPEKSQRAPWASAAAHPPNQLELIWIQLGNAI